MPHLIDRLLPPSSDPEEQRLREEWHKARNHRDAVFADPAVADRDTCLQEATAAFARAHRSLSDYIWNRAQRDVEADRRKHPKAKRNQPKPDGITSPGGRALP